MRSARSLGALLLFAGAAAQTPQPAPRLEFEVATIKPSGPRPPPEVLARIVIQRGPIYFDYPRISLFGLVMMAHGMDNSQVLVPDWMKEELFDISAKAPQAATGPQVNIMLQNLLADRFHLVFHRETKELPVYELTVAKGGVKMLDSSLGKSADPRGSPLPEQKEGGSLWLDPGKGPIKYYTRSEDGVTLATGRAARLSDVTFLLDRRLRAFDSNRQVLDKTGLTGTYDFGIQFRDPSADNSPRLRDKPSDAPTIFAAVEQYLGLKIEAANRPREVIVVDSADRTPIEN